VESNVPYWPKADTPTLRLRVRYWEESGHACARQSRQLMTQS